MFEFLMPIFTTFLVTTTGFTVDLEEGHKYEFIRTSTSTAAVYVDQKLQYTLTEGVINR